MVANKTCATVCHHNRTRERAGQRTDSGMKDKDHLEGHVGEIAVACHPTHNQKFGVRETTDANLEDL